MASGNRDKMEERELILESVEEGGDGIGRRHLSKADLPCLIKAEYLHIATYFWNEEMAGVIAHVL